MREKKFNIWIAYSDLFSNLTTFLFISALGMFAAFGSGSAFNEAPDINSIRTVCNTDIGDLNGALLTKVNGNPNGFEEAQPVKKDGQQPACTRYFPLQDYAFVSDGQVRLFQKHSRHHSHYDPMRDFVSIHEDINSTDAARDRFCPVLFGAAMRQSLTDKSGTLKIVGTASRGFGLKCKLLADIYVAVPGQRAGVGASVLAACDEHDADALRNNAGVCASVDDCKKHPENSGCPEINSGVIFGRVNATNCLEDYGLRRAQAIKKICAAELNDNTHSFNLQLAGAEGSSIFGRNLDSAQRRALVLQAWDRMHVEGMPLPDGNVDGINLPPNGIVIKVEFRPPLTDGAGH